MAEGYPGEVGDDEEEDDYYDNEEPAHFVRLMFWVFGIVFLFEEGEREGGRGSSCGRLACDVFCFMSVSGLVIIIIV